MQSIKPQFHLSLGVKSIEASVAFFERALKATVEHRDSSGYVNINFFGTQITLKEDPGASADIPHFHFGVNLALEEFELVARNLLERHRGSVVAEPKVVDPGTPLERKKMYVRCPTGYLIEIKGYKEA